MPSEQPKVLLRGKLKLTFEQEKRLMQHAQLRREAIRTEMGFMANVGTSGLGVSAGHSLWRGACYTGWAQIRAEAHAQYENDFTHRSLPGNSKRFSSLYQNFNNSVNVPKRAISVYKARACEALVNTTPFTGFMPEGEDDNAEAIKLAERYFHAALEDADARFHYREAITQACLSEAVLKTTLTPVGGEPEMVEDAQIWLMFDGQPLRDMKGGYVFSDEELDDHPDILGLKVLRRDPSVEFKGDEMLSPPGPMLRNTPTKNKLSVQPVGWENFFCSILEPDIHSADCCFHEFDEDFDVLLKRTEGMRLSRPAKQWLETVRHSAQTYAQSEGAQPKLNRGETEPQMFGPVKVHICEQWIRFDVMDRGHADELCVTWAVNSGGAEAWPIYYEMMRDASPTKKRPFEVLRVIPVRDRWYGFGFYDLLSNDHEFVDDAWNRIRARSSASGRFDWMARDSWEGLEYGQPASMSQGRVYIRKSGTQGPINEHAGSVAFPELDEKIWKMLEMALQNAQLHSGTMTPADSAMSNLPSNNTATGQDLLANESEMMSNDTTQDVIRGLTASLRQDLIAVFGNFDEEAANLLLGVDDAKKLMEWLRTAKPEQFAAHIKLLLTKARSKQALQAASQANQLITGGMSWLQIVQQIPAMAEQLKPFFVDMLNALDVSNADNVLKIPPEMIAQQQMMAAQAAAQPAPAA